MHESYLREAYRHGVEGDIESAKCNLSKGVEAGIVALHGLLDQFATEDLPLFLVALWEVADIIERHLPRDAVEIAQILAGREPDRRIIINDVNWAELVRQYLQEMNGRDQE